MPCDRPGQVDVEGVAGVAGADGGARPGEGPARSDGVDRPGRGLPGRSGGGPRAGGSRSCRVRPDGQPADRPPRGRRRHRVEPAASSTRGGRAAAWSHRLPVPAEGLVPVDLDGSLVLAHSVKEAAAPTFKRTYGHHPLLAFVDHTSAGDGAGGSRWPRSFAPAVRTQRQRRPHHRPRPRARPAPRIGPRQGAGPRRQRGRHQGVPRPHCRAWAAILRRDRDRHRRRPRLAHPAPQGGVVGGLRPRR